MESCLLSEHKIKGYRKSMLSLWLQKGMFWVLEQRLLNQTNTISKNSWMTELKKDGLKRKVTKSDSVIVEEVLRLCLIIRRNVLPEMGAEEHVESLDEEEVDIIMETAKLIDRGRKERLPALRNMPKKKLLEETAKVDKVLSKLKKNSVKKTNKLLYA